MFVWVCGGTALGNVLNRGHCLKEHGFLFYKQCETKSSLGMFWAPFLSRSVPVGQVTDRPDHACSQHSGFSSHHDDTAALGNRVRRHTTATRQKKKLPVTPQRAARNSSEQLGGGGRSRVHLIPDQSLTSFTHTEWLP